MNKKILLLGIVIILIFIVILFGAYNKMKYTSKMSIQIINYPKGKEIKLEPDSFHFKELQKKSESLFINANNILDLIVTGKTIDEAKESASVEILYSEPKEFNVQLGKPHIIKVDALLISLKNNSAVIYYSVNGSYSSGPYVNTKEDVNELRDLLNSI